MSDGQRVDGDDYTWDWMQALGDAGHFTVDEDGIGVSYLDSNTGDAPKLYGTMHNGEVKGVAIADVPTGNDVLRQWYRATVANCNGYNTQTHPETVQAIIWEMSKHMAELAEQVRVLHARNAALEQRLDEMEAAS